MSQGVQRVLYVTNAPPNASSLESKIENVRSLIDVAKDEVEALAMLPKCASRPGHL